MGDDIALQTREMLSGGGGSLQRQLALQWLDGLITIIYHNDDTERSAFAGEVEQRLRALVKGSIYHLYSAGL